MKILVADDQSDAPETIKVFLEDLDHEVTTACNGRETSAILEKKVFDLVILDDAMPPGPDGHIIILNLKKKNRTEKTILMSAYKEVDFIARMVRSDGFLSKPFRIEELFECVDAIFKEKRAAAL